MTFFESIEQWDQKLFLFLNGLHHPSLDGVMGIITWPPTWIPLYLFLIVLVWRKWGTKPLLLFLMVAGLMILFTDQTTNLFKSVIVGRYRPCHNEDFGHLVHLVSGCGGKYGFFSGHSSNSFAMATFIVVILRLKKWKWVIWAWAGMVAYSRIYVGVHYPLDIFCGSLCGLFYGFLFAKLYFTVGKRVAWLKGSKLNPTTE